MQDLRLIGVHEDGQHLLMSDDAGNRYRVPLDEQLRAAARRDRAHLGQLQIELDGGMRPREVQALIRRGLSTQEVAERAGWTVEKVRRYEGPILAEREYVVVLARRTPLPARTGSSTTLEARVHERLDERGVEPSRAAWDSARRDDGQWSVSAVFPAGGRERTATWRFDVQARTLVPVDDEARWLSEDAQQQGPLPTPHVATRGPREQVYDVESAGGVVAGGATPRRREDSPDLMATMREHSGRGRRRRRHSPAATSVEQPREDALPLEELAGDLAAAPEPPAAHGDHPVEHHLDSGGEPAPEPETAPAAQHAPEPDSSHPPEPVAPSLPKPTPQPAAESGEQDRAARPETDDTEADTSGEQAPEARKEQTSPPTQTSASGAATEPEPAQAEAAHAEAAHAPAPAPEPAAAKPKGKRGRPSVPSWDDIMFGGGSRG